MSQALHDYFTQHGEKALAGKKQSAAARKRLGFCFAGYSVTDNAKRHWQQLLRLRGFDPIIYDSPFIQGLQRN